MFVEPEILIPPVKPKGKYHIVDSGGVCIGFLNHVDIRDYVIELINGHMPNGETIAAINELESEDIRGGGALRVPDTK